MKLYSNYSHSILFKGAASSVSPQPGPSRESDQSLDSTSTNHQFFGSKRKQRSPKYQVSPSINFRETTEDTELLSLGDQSSKEVNECEEDEDDDITLQDLVAMETMDDADELDINSDNSFQNDSVHNMLRNECSSMDSTKSLPEANSDEGFAPQRYFSGTNMESQFIHSSSSPLQSYRNTMKHITGKTNLLLFGEFYIYRYNC